MIWFCMIGVGCVLLFLAAGAAAGLLAVRKIYGRRYNGNPNVKYFGADDFPGLRAEPVEFLSGGTTLRGYIYSREGVPAGAVLFSHGFGAGHTAYTTEIDRLTRAGFRVLAFDNTGCMRSGGARLEGFDRGVADLLAAAAFARGDDRLRGLPTAFVGHSWGAFSVMNALPQSEGVSCAVAMCGFIRGADVLAQNVFGRFAPLRAVMACTIRLCMRLRFGRRANLRSDRSLRAARKPAYLLYGRKDATVRFPWNGKKMASAFAGDPFVRVDVFAEKGHNVYLSLRAERAMHETFGAIAAVGKKDKARAASMYRAVDYAAITEEDEEVMEGIVRFLRENMR